MPLCSAMDTPPHSSTSSPPASKENEGSSTLEQRQLEYQRWCREIRDPAIQRSEGRRVIQSRCGCASLEYEIAQLPDRRWAVTWRQGFQCGDCRGQGHPWTARATREECLDLVLTSARAIFATNYIGKGQRAVARAMQQLLGDGLFGFLEPEPTPSIDDEIGE